MRNYTINNLRNIGLIGHNGTGKTALAESILYYSNMIERLGKIEYGTTIMDFDSEEKKKQFSISLSVAPVELDDVKINIVDIPGYADFQGELIQGMRAVDVGMIVVSGVSGIKAGDIGVISKLQYTNTGDTLCSSDFKIIYDKMNFSSVVCSMFVIPKAKGDEDKISQSLAKLKDEDPVFEISRDIENAETIISGLGETHINIISSKIKNKYGVDIDLELPKIPYKETIKGFADVQGKHKKQSGGHGQYGDVVIRFESREDGEDDLEFIDKVVGGAISKNFIQAVEKGLRECILHGVLAGYPGIGLRATVHDGSYHSVDSSEMAFKIAASIAYKKGLEQAKPILLEPIMQV